MRSTPIILAALILGGPAIAQTWEEYSYPDYAFSVDFPAKPVTENRTYQIADNRSVPARVYSVRQNSSELKITIADLANTGLDETSVIDYAIKALSAGGDVTFNIPQRIDSVYGRSVGIQRRDGSRSTIGVFNYRDRLYQIEAKALPGGSDAAAETLRFHQSLAFTDGGSNRSEDTIRAYRQACPDTIGPPAGFDDPRCPGNARK
jgi:hypothetical protein